MTYLLKNKNVCFISNWEFSVTDPFLTTFYYVEKLNAILRKNRGRGLKNLTYPYMGVGRVNNCQNHSYVINEWPLTDLRPIPLSNRAAIC